MKVVIIIIIVVVVLSAIETIIKKQKKPMNAEQMRSQGIDTSADSVFGNGSDRLLFPIYDRVSGKYGYIDQTGRVVIKPQFDSAGRFSDGLAEVTKSMKSGYIDNTGQIVIPTTFSNSSSCDFHEGMALVEGGLIHKFKVGYIDKRGVFVVGYQFAKGGHFSE